MVFGGVGEEQTPILNFVNIYILVSIYPWGFIPTDFASVLLLTVTNCISLLSILIDSVVIAFGQVIYTQKNVFL